MVHIWKIIFLRMPDVSSSLCIIAHFTRLLVYVYALLRYINAQFKLIKCNSY